MKALNIAVLGATGAVGQEMLKILAEYDIPVNELRPLASAKSVGKCISFKGKDVPIQEANDDSGFCPWCGRRRHVQALCTGY